MFLRCQFAQDVEEFPLTPEGMAQAVLEGWGNSKAVDLSHSNANFPFFPVSFFFFKFLLSSGSKGSVPSPSKQRTFEQCLLHRD